MSVHNKPDRFQKSPPPEDGLPAGTGALGLKIFLVSLTMLFGATLIGYLFVRFRASAWPPEGMPALPLSLIFSTAILLASSATAHGALDAARSGSPALRRWLWVTLGFGVLFVLSQAYSWAELLPAVREIGLRDQLAKLPTTDQTPRQFAFLFYTLTGLHALHVVGGLIALGLAIRGSMGALSVQTLVRRVRHAVIYWHFLDAIWIVMYVVLLV